MGGGEWSAVRIVPDIIRNWSNKKIVEIVEVKKAEIKNYPEDIINNGVIRTLPYMYNKKGGMDGFFVARLKKISHN